MSSLSVPSLHLPSQDLSIPAGSTLTTSLATSSHPPHPPLPTGGISLASLEGRGDIRSMKVEPTPIDMLVLPNNSVLEISDPRKDVKVYAPALGSDNSLLESTNSPFTKISEVITYSWPKDLQGNIMATHRTLPLVAYIINTGYHKSLGQKTAAKSNPMEQMVRLVNASNGVRALGKPITHDFIVDIAFAFDNSKRTANMVATVDRSGYVNIFRFEESSLHDPSRGVSYNLSIERILTIRPSPDLVVDPSIGLCRLAWCPYIPSEEPDQAVSVDPSLRLAVTTGRNLELFTFCDYHFKNKDTVDRSFFRVQIAEYYKTPNAHDGNIVSVAVSNDGSLICTASADNIVKFFQEDVQDGRVQLKFLRSWTPTLNRGEQIAEVNFLDDYDFLLAHSEHSFWGYLTIGTTNGSIYLFDLRSKDWKCTQEIKVHYKESESNEPFSYRVDKASRSILARKENNCFLLLLDYECEDKAYISSEEDEDNVTRVVRRPQIKHVGRFQLYNPVVSLQLGKSTESEVDLYWITLKNLEKCNIDFSSLKECIVKPNLISETPRSRKINTVTPSPSLPDSGKQLVHMLSSPPVVQSQPESKEQELLKKIQQNTLQLDRLKEDKRKSDPKSLATPNLMDARTPSKVVSPKTPNPILEKLNITQTSNVSIPSSPAIPVYAPPSVNAMPVALNDMAKVMLLEDQINQLRQQVVTKLDDIQTSVATVFKGVQSEFSQMKAHSTEVEKQKFKNTTEKTIDLVVQKAMDQLNVHLSNGIRDFFQQVDTDIGELQASVKNHCEQLETQVKDTNDKLSDINSQLAIFQTQLEKNSAEQQLLLYKFQQLTSLPQPQNFLR